VRAANAGVNGVIVSNHGGKTLDRAPATVDALVAIAAAVGDRIVVMLDSGVRRGSDVIVGLCLGARFVFVGRAALYGVTVGGVAGARRALDILREEIDMTMALIGCQSVAELGPDFLFESQDRIHNQAVAAE
jgi:L-lactate dehydrogenase (cytochrome)/(S)-mandelate dehydrogenase